MDGTLARTIVAGTGGAWVAAGDLDGDGKAEVIVSAGSSPKVEVFDGATGARTNTFSPYGPKHKGGVRVAAADVDGDGLLEVVTASANGLSRVRAFHAGDATPVLDFLPMDGNFDGLFIGGGD
jgi:fibronectin-binding autotransporter adhesin